MAFDKLFKSYRKTIQYLNNIGILLIIVGSVGHFLELSIFKYLFSLGALLVVFYNIIQIFQIDNPDFRQKRLLRINVMMSLLLVLGAYSMFDGTSLWMVVILIYALVILMMTFRT
ncbi:hypothetical protein MASR2M117_03990 [Paludibacter sp.]